MRRVFARFLALFGLLVLAACGSASTSQATVTPTVMLPSGWDRASLPFTIDTASDQLVIAPGDGMVAYGCTIRKDGFTIWGTSDGGKTWAKAAPFPGPVPSLPLCDISIDAGDAHSLAVRVDLYEQFFSHDAGKSWTPIASTLSIDTPATYQGVTYAIVQNFDPARTLSGFYPVAISRDGWKTWTSLQPERPYPTIPRKLYLNVKNGTMLIRDVDSFWESKDVGKTWGQFGNYPDHMDFFVTPALTGGDWVVCAAPVPTASLPATCTYDSGKHTKTLPPLDSIVAGQLVDTRGNVIVQDLTEDSEKSGYFRLTPDGTEWQKVAVPDMTYKLLYAPLPESGIVWGLALDNHTIYRAPATVLQ
jgi:hypothetical protein